MIQEMVRSWSCEVPMWVAAQVVEKIIVGERAVDDDEDWRSPRSSGGARTSRRSRASPIFIINGHLQKISGFSNLHHHSTARSPTIIFSTAWAPTHMGTSQDQDGTISRIISRVLPRALSASTCTFEARGGC